MTPAPLRAITLEGAITPGRLLDSAPMLWEQTFVEETLAQLQRLGLNACSVCGSDLLGVDRRPVVQSVGGTEEMKDKYTNVVYLFRVVCSVCGLSLTFDAERFRDGDAPMFVQGPPA